MLTLAQSKTALGPNLTASFLASGGTPPYAYSVLGGGAGGSINSATGVYTAPSIAPTDPKLVYDTVEVTDALAATAIALILVGLPLLLFCEILEQELGLANGRAFLWNQKIFQPTDNGLYIAISVPRCKPFSNITKPDPVTGWFSPIQITNFLATLDINAISRDTSALMRKEEIIMALNSVYSQQQQEANGFYIAKLPPGSAFTNLSYVDGAAIPYRYAISVNMQYFSTKQKATPYFDTFQSVTEQIEA